MGGRHDVRTRGMELRVDRKRGPVDGPVPLDDPAVVVDEDQIGDPDPGEVDAERVDPEVVEAFGVACGDVAGDPLVETAAREQPECGGETLLAVQPLLFGRCERPLTERLDVGHGRIPSLRRGSSPNSVRRAGPTSSNRRST